MLLVALARDWYLAAGVIAMLALLSRDSRIIDIALASAVVLFFLLGWPRC